MEKSLFKNILSIVNENIDECKKYLDKVKTTEDLKNLTINQLIELRNVCRKQQSRMDSVLRYELYHLIGMGQLTIIQQTQLYLHLNNLLIQFQFYYLRNGQHIEEILKQLQVT